MKADYYNPRIELLLCRFRVVEKWDEDFSVLRDPFWRLYHHPGLPAKFRAGGVLRDCGPDVIALIPPDTPFSPATTAPFEQFYVHFRASHPFDSCKREVLEFPAEPRLLSQIDAIKAMLKDEEARPSRRLSMTILRLCEDALLLVPDSLLDSGSMDARIEEAVSFMESNFKEGVDNRRLARRAGMNVNSFIRLFKAQTGSTPQAVLRDRRVREACILLRFSSLSVDEIASATGFVDRSHLSRVFRAVRGASPAAFRRGGLT